MNETILIPRKGNEMESTPLNGSTENRHSNITLLNRLIIVYNGIKSDIISYINEYGLSIGRNSKEIKEKLAQIVFEVEKYDVVIFSKKGCSYCDRAKNLINQKQVEMNFTQNVVIGTESNIKTALGLALDLMDVTFPQIIIRGTYIGGHDDLLNLISEDKLRILIQADHIESYGNKIPWYPPLLKQTSTPNLFASPNISSSTTATVPWYCFQPYLYGNLIRYISLIHVAIVGICLGLLADSGSKGASILSYILIIYLTIDCGLIVIHGPAPFSPSGTIATYFCWKYRGTITSSIPYKFVFGFYVAGFIALLLTDNLTGTVAIASLTSTIINSAVLVAFRF